VRMLRGHRDVPFSAEAVDGWRAWSVIEHDGDVWLSSLTRAEDWPPGEPFTAACSRRRHASPGRACSCGVYAAAEPEELAGLGRIAGAVVGQVSLWGRIAQHSRGYRAEVAYPARLRLVCVVCLAEGEGAPATRVDRVIAPPRTRLVPLCDDHASGRSLPSGSDVEQRLLARYQVEPVPDASVERIRRDPRTALLEQRGRRRVLTMVAATLTLLAAVALIGEVARDRAKPAVALTTPTVAPDEIIKRPNNRTNEGGEPISSGVSVLRYAPRPSVSGQCGRVTSTAVIETDCLDARAEVFVKNVSSVGSRQGTVCGDATVVATRLGDRVTCWGALPTA
jgi:hypothetical protein